MTSEVDKGSTSTLERLSGLTYVYAVYLSITDASWNTIQSMTSHPMLERKMINILSAIEAVFWEEMDLFICILNKVDEVLKIDTANHSYCIVEPDHHGCGWGGGIL